MDLRLYHTSRFGAVRLFWGPRPRRLIGDRSSGGDPGPVAVAVTADPTDEPSPAFRAVVWPRLRPLPRQVPAGSV